MRERSIDECPGCGGWLGSMGNEVSEGAIHRCSSCRKEWEAGGWDSQLVWIAVEHEEVSHA